MNRQQIIDLLVARGVAAREQLQFKSVQQLEQALDQSNLALIRAEAQADPEVIKAKAEAAQAKAETIWQRFFFRHPEIKDHDGNRNALFERALSLSDDGVVTLQ